MASWAWRGRCVLQREKAQPGDVAACPVCGHELHVRILGSRPTFVHAAHKPRCMDTPVPLEWCPHYMVLLSDVPSEVCTTAIRAFLHAKGKLVVRTRCFQCDTLCNHDYTYNDNDQPPPGMTLQDLFVAIAMRTMPHTTVMCIEPHPAVRCRACNQVPCQSCGVSQPPERLFQGNAYCHACSVACIFCSAGSGSLTNVVCSSCARSNASVVHLIYGHAVPWAQQPVSERVRPFLFRHSTGANDVNVEPQQKDARQPMTDGSCCRTESDANETKDEVDTDTVRTDGSTPFNPTPSSSVNCIRTNQAVSTFMAAHSAWHGLACFVSNIHATLDALELRHGSMCVSVGIYELLALVHGDVDAFNPSILNMMCRDVPVRASVAHVNLDMSKVSVRSMSSVADTAGLQYHVPAIREYLAHHTPRSAVDIASSLLGLLILKLPMRHDQAPWRACLTKLCSSMTAAADTDPNVFMSSSAFIPPTKRKFDFDAKTKSSHHVYTLVMDNVNIHQACDAGWLRLQLPLPDRARLRVPRPRKNERVFFKGLGVAYDPTLHQWYIRVDAARRLRDLRITGMASRLIELLTMQFEMTRGGDTKAAQQIQDE